VTSRGDAGDEPAPEPEGAPALGWIAADVEDEFPELALVTVEVPCRTVRSAPWVAHRLTQLANRMTGAYALRVRTLPVPAAHRAFHRQLGLDPDVDRPPLEEAVFRRLWTGGFVPTGMPGDALLIALLETGVAVWALDAAHVDGELGVRTSTAGEPLGLGRAATTLGDGELVIADAARPLARLLASPSSGFAVTPDTRRAVLYVLQVPGVPAMAVQEALNTARDLLRIA
jgi:DNA/RNA-binding domain of Phe-tRNA-synthetase-like protein